MKYKKLFIVTLCIAILLTVGLTVSIITQCVNTGSKSDKPENVAEGQSVQEEVIEVLLNEYSN